jgi:hypothetical protein
LTNLRKTIINGNEYEIVPAEVIEFDYTGLSKERLYSVKCKLIGSDGSNSPSDIITARALDANIKNIPISGEVILLLKAPTAYNSVNRVGQEYYYTNPVSIQSSVHHNGIPGITQLIENKNPKNEKARVNVQDGIVNKTENKYKTESTIDPTFPERLDVYPIQPYSGDIIFEGRWGQSIRFGSTVDLRRKYPITPSWSPGYGATGNPILIISNGTNPQRQPYNRFILEDIDTDDSCIWLTSGQRIEFKPASTYSPSIEDKQVDLFRSNNYSGHQIIMASDRIVLNAKKQEIIGFSKEGIGFSSEKSFVVDAKKVVEFESARINLGINAAEPALLGNETGTWLSDLCSILIDVMTDISKLTVPTGVGPSGVPTNAGSFNSHGSDIQGLKDKIQELKSQLVFLNKKTETVNG